MRQPIAAEWMHHASSDGCRAEISPLLWPAVTQRVKMQSAACSAGSRTDREEVSPPMGRHKQSACDDIASRCCCCLLRLLRVCACVCACRFPGRFAQIPSLPIFARERRRNSDPSFTLHQPRSAAATRRSIVAASCVESPLPALVARPSVVPAHCTRRPRRRFTRSSSQHVVRACRCAHQTIQLAVSKKHAAGGGGTREARDSPIN